ncbi:hypothetical protein ACWEJ6_28140 [Nonomuraea sp. NPDC004702]
MNNYLLAAFRPGGNAARRAMAEELAALPGLPVSGEVLARVSLMSCLLRDGDLPGWDRELARCEALLAGSPRPELESMVRIAQPPVPPSTAGGRRPRTCSPGTATCGSPRPCGAAGSTGW